MMLDFIIFVLFTTASASQQICYCANQAGIRMTCGGALPCSTSTDGAGFVQCCAQNDTCGSDGFCHFTHPQDNASGWYMGGCTDPTFRDPSCPRECTDLQSQDVVYNRTTGLWYCCRKTKTDTGLAVDCTNPGSETFQALPPEEIQLMSSVVGQSSSSGSSTSLLTSTTETSILSSLASTSNSMQRSSMQLASSAASPAGPTMTPDANIHDLSTGAKAGIAVAATLVGVLAIALTSLIFIRRGKSSPQWPQNARMPVEMHSDPARLQNGSPGMWSKSELESRTRRFELAGS